VILTSVFVAASVVTLMHYTRVRRLRALPLAGMFAFLALARTQSHPTSLGFWADLLAAACGFAHLMLLVPRHAPEPGTKDGNAA
jgi:hypothetical protein